MGKKVKDHSYCIHWRLNEKQGVHSFGLSYYNAKLLAAAYDLKHKNVGTIHKQSKQANTKEIDMLKQETAINALIPKAEKLATLAVSYDLSEQCTYEHPRLGKVKYAHFKWTELFHKYMNELTKEAGLR